VSSGLSMENGSIIVDAVVVFVKRFVFLQRECMYRLVALWIIATHLHEVFQYTGYMFIHSPERQCGKTTLLEILDMLVLASTGIDCSPTPAVLSRTATGRTQLLDEGDGWADISGLRNILNAGFQRNGQTARCEQNGIGSFVAKSLHLYCPRAIAGIGREILSETTRDRTFVIEMTRRMREERGERMRRRRVEPEAHELKKLVEEWTLEHREEVAVRYDSLAKATFAYLDSFRDRTIDVAEPLAVILEVAYKDYPEQLERARMEMCEAIATAREETNQYSEDYRLLTAIEATMEGDELIEQPSVIAARLSGSVGALANEHAIGEVLRRYGFRNKSVRKDGGQPRKCYVIERSRIEDVLARYASLPTTPPA